jgi:hypothetical protein
MTGAHAVLQPPQTPQNRNLKKRRFCGYYDIIMILRNFPFSRNQPLQSADDQYIRILKNKLIKLKETRR